MISDMKNDPSQTHLLDHTLHYRSQSCSVSQTYTVYIERETEHFQEVS